MDEKGGFLIQRNDICYILPLFTIIWVSTAIFGTLIGCTKKKAGPVKKVGESAASVAASPSPIPGKSPASTNIPTATGGNGAPGAPGGGKPSTSQDTTNNNNNKNPGDGKNPAENKDDKKDEKKADEKHDEKQSEKKEDEKKDDEKKEDEKKESKKEDDKKKEPSNKDDIKKKSEKPNNGGGGGGEKKDGSGGEKPSCKPELSTNRTQPSKSVKVKDDDDTVKHIESLKEDKEKSE